MDSIAGFHSKHRFLSNDAQVPHGIRVGNLLVYTAEHAYQMQKTRDTAEQERIAFAASALAARHHGRRVTLREDWFDVRVGIMYQVLKQKFRPNSLLAKQLMLTGDKLLLATDTNLGTFWGVYNGSGENRLGQLLMSVREELRAVDISPSGTAL
jgi:ribA/ribD-fused uncharacterized protein